MDPVVSIALYSRTQSFGATVTIFFSLLVFNGIIQTIFVAFSMRTFRACTGMLSSKIMISIFLKKCAKRKKRVHRVHNSSMARGTALSFQISLSLTRNMNVKVAIELYYILSKIMKLRYW